MSKSNEFLSDLLDDRCSSEELDRLIKDENTSDTWYRYNLVSGILKNESSAVASNQFCQAVSAKIAQEPAIIATKANLSKAKDKAQASNAPVSNLVALRRFSGGMAIAASVAFATFFSLSQLDTSNLNQIDQASVASSNSMPANAVETTSIPNTIEQTELEVFNDLFLREAKRSERGAFAPVGGEYVKTIRFSKEQWQQIIQQAVLQKAELEAAKKKAELEAQEAPQNQE